MIDRAVFGFVVSCDGCSFYEEVEVLEFRELIGRMKKEGWVMRKDGQDVWMHYCPVCARKNKKIRRE